MECISRGFCEVNRKSTTDDSIHYRQKGSDGSTTNIAAANNENIAYIFNKEDLVETYLESVALQNSGVVLLRNYKTLFREDHAKLIHQVKILSGGAATTDPLYSGSIGPGMLTGAVYGEMKKSPPSLVILEVLRVMSHKNKHGILVIVLNNLANRLNFGSACQNAAREGIKTLLVNVGEDVSGVSVNKAVGRSGLCGIKFLYKIAGAMSEEKRTIYEIHHVIEQLKGKSLGTINVGIRPDVMVIGPGSKGESEKLYFLWNTFDDIGETARLSFIVRQALSHIFHPSSYFSLNVANRDKIAVIINNLGKLSDLYLSLIVKEVLDQMDKLGLKVMRIYSGRFLNSNLAGFSISVLKVKDNILDLLDRPVNATSWPERLSSVSERRSSLEESCSYMSYVGAFGDRNNLGSKFTKQQAAYLLDVLPIVIESIQNMEEYLNKLDNDHDFGTKMNKFSNSIKSEIQKRTLKISTPYEFLEQMAYLAGMTMGGVSGGIFNILFSSAAQAFLGTSPMGSPNISMWMNAAQAARDGLQRYTRVQPGDGTILDALDPFVEYTSETSVKGLSKRVSAAVMGAEGTTFRSSRGSKVSRVSTMETTGNGSTRKTDAAQEVVRAPDPGALCLAAVIRTIFTCLQIELAEAEAAEEATKAEAEAVKAKAAAAEAAAISMTSSPDELLEKESNNQELKESTSKNEKKKEKMRENAQMLKEQQSVHILQIVEVFEEIAKEIEDEVPDENN